MYAILGRFFPISRVTVPRYSCEIRTSISGIIVSNGYYEQQISYIISWEIHFLPAAPTAAAAAASSCPENGLAAGFYRSSHMQRG